MHYPTNIIAIRCKFKYSTGAILNVNSARAKFNKPDNKHSMTGLKGNSEFCFPETLNIEVEGKQNSLFPERPEIGRAHV